MPAFKVRLESTRRGGAVFPRWIASLGLMALVAASLGVPVAASAAPTPSAPRPAVAPDENAAVRAAARAGSRVEALSQRTEVSQVFAEPSGELTYEASAVPQRVRQPDGSWQDVDLDLEPGRDGLLRPRASVADVRFSAGGAAPLATIVRAGRSMTVGWPLGPLPAPSVTADAATYEEVRPGVDLVVRATRTGFTHVLVVKNATAAADSAIRQINLDIGGDAEVQSLPDGSLQAVRGGELIARSGVPMMWDSSSPRAGNTARRAGASAPVEGSDHVGPGDGARTALLATEVTAEGDLVLRADTALLGADVRYPVFVDPEWSVGRSRWAYATNNNSNNTDVSRARVGRDPNSGKLYRSFFEFPTSAIKGKHVESAYVQMELDHSWSCTDTWTHLFHTGAVTTPRTAWKTSLTTRLSAAESRGNEGSGCHDSPQPDMTINFTGSAITKLMSTVATRGASNVTLGLSAGNETGQYETSTDRWKKFYPEKAKLIATVDARPGRPTGLQINGVACGSADVLIGTTSPYFSAVVPDADGATQTLVTTWEFFKIQGGVTTKLPAPPRSTTTANTRTKSTRVSAPGAAGVRYGFRVQSQDPAPFNITSEWSAPCHFTVDGTRPTLTIQPLSPPTGPGKSGTFLLKSDSDVVRFQYGWTDAATSSVLPKAGPDATSKVATITVTAPRYGENILYAKAIDATNNKGDGSFQFTVGRPAPPVAHWGLETYPGADEAAALADRQPAVSGTTQSPDTPLSATGVGWTPDAHIIGGKAAAFSGTPELSAGRQVINTHSSFSVAAWVRPNAVPSVDWGVVTQDGVSTQGFGLGTRLVGTPLTPRWSFAMKDADLQSSPTRAAYSATALAAADVDRWTHIAGVYDKEAGEIRLYVNGVLAAQQPRTAAPWNAQGKLGVGRYVTAGALNGWFQGNIADVQVYDRALAPEDFTGQLATADGSGGYDEPGMLSPILIGAWNFETAVPCYEAGTPNGCEAPDIGTGWQRRFALTPGTSTGPGIRGQGLAFDDVHFVEDEADPHYGETTRESGSSERDVAAAGQPRQWQHGPILRTDQAFSVSVWLQPTRLGQSMSAVTQSGLRPAPTQFSLGTEVTSTAGGLTETRFEVTAGTGIRDQPTHLTTTTALDPDDTTLWYHLVYVYDPTDSVSQRLYVNGELAAQGTRSHGHGQTSLTIGHGWHGAIDELGLYQGALTASQVLALHRATPTS